MPRIPARALTPALRAEFDAFVRRIRPKGFAGVGPRSSIEKRASDVIFRYEMRGILPVSLVLSSGFAFSFVTLLNDGPFFLGGLPFLGGLALMIPYQRLKPYGRSPTADFLNLALPSLDLSPAERRYAEALTLGGPPERLNLLRRLAEESARLDTLAARLGPPLDSREREAIQADLNSATDPAARAALERSLILADSRLEDAQRADALRQRLNAHRTLLDQSARSIAEGIALRDPLPETTLTRAADLGAEVAALEAAVAEMRTL